MNDRFWTKRHLEIMFQDTGVGETFLQDWARSIAANQLHQNAHCSWKNVAEFLIAATEILNGK
jgi:hypothetical protein